METRKLQLVGSRSYAISLPKTWVLDHKLKPQDTVFIERMNERLVISHGPLEQEASTLTIAIKDIDDIGEFLNFSYVKGVQKLIIKLTQESPEEVTKIRNALKYLEGYEITAESEKQIEISFLFTEFNITVPQLLTRISHLLQITYTGLREGDKAMLHETEMVIDRLYHLGKRIVFACINDRGLRERNGFHHHEDLFFTKDILKKLENFGDVLLKLNMSELSPNELSQAKELLTMTQELIREPKDLGAIKKRLLATNITSRKPEVKQSLERLRTLTKDILENKLSIGFNKRYF